MKSKAKKVVVLNHEFQMELPLFFTDERKEKKTAKVIPFEVRIKWSLEEVNQLREGMLSNYLRLLTDNRASSAAKQETMEWMKSDAIEPFSFITCCLASGCDPEIVRDGVIAFLNR